MHYTCRRTWLRTKRNNARLRSIARKRFKLGVKHRRGRNGEKRFGVELMECQCQTLCLCSFCEMWYIYIYLYRYDIIMLYSMPFAGGKKLRSRNDKIIHSLSLSLSFLCVYHACWKSLQIWSGGVGVTFSKHAQIPLPGTSDYMHTVLSDKKKYMVSFSITICNWDIWQGSISKGTNYLPTIICPRSYSKAPDDVSNW